MYDIDAVFLSYECGIGSMPVSQGYLCAVKVIEGRNSAGLPVGIALARIPLYGEQEVSVYIVHFRCTCYHPLFCFDQFRDWEWSMMRPGNAHSAERWKGL